MVHPGNLNKTLKPDSDMFVHMLYALNTQIAKLQLSALANKDIGYLGPFSGSSDPGRIFLKECPK